MSATIAWAIFVAAILLVGWLRARIKHGVDLIERGGME